MLAFSDFVQGGAIGPFVLMANSNERSKLRAMAVEALQVLSEDFKFARLTRPQFGCVKMELIWHCSLC